MEAVQIFVIRIYRRDLTSLVGQVEAVPSGRTTAFRSLRDLCRVLLDNKPPTRLRRCVTPER